jgi:hypothetical protein
LRQSRNNLNRSPPSKHASATEEEDHVPQKISTRGTVIFEELFPWFFVIEGEATGSTVRLKKPELLHGV